MNTILYFSIHDNCEFSILISISSGLELYAHIEKVLYMGQILRQT